MVETRNEFNTPNDTAVFTTKIVLDCNKTIDAIFERS